METLKTLTYAGLGLAMQTNEKIKAEFNDLVEVGKKTDLEGKNIVGGSTRFRKGSAKVPQGSA